MREKRKTVLWMLLALCFMLGMSAQAATVNPFKGVKSTTSTTILSSVNGKGCNYFTPEYKKDFKMTATSSNKKVVSVKTYSFTNGKTGKDKRYYKGFEATILKPGSANVKVTIKIDGKTYSKVFKYTAYKYENPFSSFKIGGKNYTSKLSKLSGSTRVVKWTVPAGTLQYKLKKGYKITSIYMFDTKGKAISVKSGKKIPKGAHLCITYQNTKSKATGSISIIKK